MLIYLGHCRIGWLSWPIGRIRICRCRCSTKLTGRASCFSITCWTTTGFEPNVFTAIIPGVNDGNVQLTATGGNCGLPTVGAVRVALEPKPGLPTDPTNPRAFNDVFTDISPLFVINNEAAGMKGG